MYFTLVYVFANYALHLCVKTQKCCVQHLIYYTLQISYYERQRHCICLKTAKLDRDVKFGHLTIFWWEKFSIIPCQSYIYIYVLLTVHLSIFILVINKLDAQNLFYNKFISCLYQSSLNMGTGRPPTECDDTRGCIIQFWPRDDEHMVIETCRGMK